MNSNTQSISIHAPPSQVAAFIADGENLPRWAVGFAKSVRRDADGWIVGSGGADIPLRITAWPESGVVDFRFVAPGGSESLAAARALPNANGTELLFTQFQGAGMSDADFARSVGAVAHELAVLRALLEVECPM